ncbi:MAG: hypothetical protein HY286_17370 [Planctomycetes bacterium]|nr:hypothetical protein [Planctomycetota bacterium]
MNSFTACILYFILNAIPLSGARQSRPVSEVIILKNNERLKVTEIGVHGEIVHLRVRVSGGTAEIERRIDEFEPHSGYKILAAVANKQSADDRLNLAAFAARNGLVSAAERELALARNLAHDPALGKDIENEIIEKGAAALEQLFKDALKKNELSKARRYLSEMCVKYPGAESARRAESLLSELASAEDRTRVDAAAQSAAREAAATRARRESLLSPIRKHLVDGADANKKGLLASKRIGEALGFFGSARDEFASAFTEAEKLLKDRKSDPELAGLASALQQLARNDLVDTLLNAGSLATVQGDFRGAIGRVNEAIAYDPANRDARDLRARIEIAANAPRLRRSDY